MKATTVHHKKYLRLHPELALDPDNLEPICERCHYDEHHRKKPGFTNEDPRLKPGRAKRIIQNLFTRVLYR